MRRRASKTVSTVFFALLVLFLFHEIALSSIFRSPLSPSASITGKRTNLTTSRWRVPQQTTQLQPFHYSTAPIGCNRSNERYDICFLNGPTVLDPSTSTAFLVDPSDPNPPLTDLKIRPYPRKWENTTMARIKELTLSSAPSYTSCDVHHHASALVFSAGGYTGNLFHDFNDGFIPLFLTSRTIFTEWDPVLVVVNCRHWWLAKYAELLKQFTRYPIVNLDIESRTHCFPSVTIGLISHGYMTINPQLMPRSENFLSFRAFLRAAYEHTEQSLSQLSISRPRLVLVARTGDVGRVILNQVDVKEVAEKLGFEVIIFQPTRYTSLVDAYGMINRSHAMLGVHGAALTHSLFLRPGSVFVQVVPIGVDWLAETCFGKPARDMGLEYMEYKVDVKESTLVEKYGEGSLVLRNPRAVTKEAFSATKNIYLKNQDVKLDLEKVGRYLRLAYEKAKIFMDREG